MAKTRAQRKAERRKKQQAQQRQKKQKQAQARAQQETQVPESASVAEAELAERGANLEELRGEKAPKAPAPSRGERAPSRAKPSADGEAKVGWLERRRLERERKRRAREAQQRRRPREEPQEKQRGRVLAFLISCWHELRRVQWPDRETLAQASAVTLIFIAVAATYLGALDAFFNWLVKLVI